MNTAPNNSSHFESFESESNTEVTWQTSPITARHVCGRIIFRLSAVYTESNCCDVTRRKLSLKLIGYCRQSSYTDSEVVFTLLPAVAWVLKSQFAPGYMHFNKCFEGVSGKRGIFHNGKLAIEVFFLSRPAIDFSYCISPSVCFIAGHSQITVSQNWNRRLHPLMLNV